jgi:hypothetical protein
MIYLTTLYEQLTLFWCFRIGTRTSDGKGFRHSYLELFRGLTSYDKLRESKRIQGVGLIPAPDRNQNLSSPHQLHVQHHWQLPVNSEHTRHVTALYASPLCRDRKTDATTNELSFAKKYGSTKPETVLHNV